MSFAGRVGTPNSLPGQSSGQAERAAADVKNVRNTGRERLAKQDETANWTLRVSMRPDSAKKIEKAMDLMRSGSSIGEAARASGYLSGPGFRAAFKKHQGVEPSAWLNWQGLVETKADRVRHAENLMLAGGLTLSQIAVRVGYSHLASLSLAFKAVHGVSPSEWMRSARGCVDRQS